MTAETRLICRVCDVAMSPATAMAELKWLMQHRHDSDEKLTNLPHIAGRGLLGDRRRPRPSEPEQWLPEEPA